MGVKHGKFLRFRAEGEKAPKRSKERERETTIDTEPRIDATQERVRKTFLFSKERERRAVRRRSGGRSLIKKMHE